MVAISSSFVLLAVLASATAAPAAVKRDSNSDAFLEVDLLSDDRNKASLLDVDVDNYAHQHRPALSSRLFSKRTIYYTSESQHDDDDALLDVTLLGDDHSADRTAHDDYLLDVDIRRRAPQTTGDLVSGPDAGAPVEYAPEIQRLRSRMFLGSRGRKGKTHSSKKSPSPSTPTPAPTDALVDVEVVLKRNLLDLTIGGHDHYVHYDQAASSVAPASAPTPTAAAAAAPPPASSSSAAPSSPSPSSGGSLVFDPSGIKKQNIVRPSASIKASGVKSTSKPKIHAAVKSSKASTASAALNAVATDVPSTLSASVVPVAPMASAAPATVYHAHDGSLLDVDILKKREYPEAFDRRPASMEPLAAVLLTAQDSNRMAPWETEN